MQTDLKFYFLCAKCDMNYHCAGSVTSNRIGEIFKYSRFAVRITHCIIFSIRSQSPISYKCRHTPQRCGYKRQTDLSSFSEGSCKTHSSTTTNSLNHTRIKPV